MSRFLTASLLCAAVALFAAPVFAGPLAFHPNAIPGFTGTTPYSNGILSGTVDYAVFLPGDWPGYAGYSPTPGEAVYTYQIYVDGAAPVSSLAVAIDPPNPANNIGWFFDGDGTFVPTGAFLSGPPDTAEWDFSGITAGSASVGLAFSSPNLPMEFFGSVQDTGIGAFVIPLPSPGPVPIPEPSSLVLSALGAAFLVVAGRRYRRS